MYIIPNSTIIILKNVPINSDYIHTLWFSTLAEQTTYFQSKAKYTLNNNYYVNRDNVNEVQVDLSTASLVDCNYIMFRNQNHENKWIYAFIKEVRYKNEDNSVIVFEIDDIQTWLFNMRLKESFVERQHTITDAKGEWRVPENLEQGDYLFTEVTNTKTQLQRGDMSIVVLATFNKNFEDSQGQFNSSSPTSRTGMYSGLSTIVLKDWDSGGEYNPSNPTVKPFFERVASEAKQDGIVAVYMLPSAYAKDTASYEGTADRGFTYWENEIPALTSIDGYTPKNKKLFTNPYVKFVVTDGISSMIEFNYEDFANGIPVFRIDGLATGKPEVRVIPTSYKGVPINYNESFYLSHLPMVAYNTDAYKAWLAQNTVSMGMGLLGNTLGSGLGIAGSIAMLSNPVTAPAGVLGIMGSSVNLASSAGGAIAKTHEASIMPNRAGGSQGYGATSIYQGEYGFRFYSVTCRREFARMIDNYFTMFGYKINRVQVPNIKARPYYTFIKTKGCTVQGELPSDSASAIRNIMDNGVTFWNITACETANATVGDYSKLANSVGDAP